MNRQCYQCVLDWGSQLFLVSSFPPISSIHHAFPTTLSAELSLYIYPPDCTTAILPLPHEGLLWKIQKNQEEVDEDKGDTT